MLNKELRSKNFLWWIIISRNVKDFCYRITVVPSLRKIPLSYAKLNTSSFVTEGVEEPLDQTNGHGLLYTASSKSISWGEHLALSIQTLSETSEITLADCLALLITSKKQTKIYQACTTSDSMVYAKLPYGSSVVAKKSELLAARIKGNSIRRFPSLYNAKSDDDDLYYSLMDNNVLSTTDKWSEMSQIAVSLLQYYTNANNSQTILMPEAYDNLIFACAAKDFPNRNIFKGEQNKAVSVTKEDEAIFSFRKAITGKSVDVVFPENKELFEKVSSQIRAAKVSNFTNTLLDDAICVLGIEEPYEDLAKFILHTSLNTTRDYGLASPRFYSKKSLKYTTEDIEDMLERLHYDPSTGKKSSKVHDNFDASQVASAYMHLFNLKKHNYAIYTEGLNSRNTCDLLDPCFHYPDGSSIVKFKHSSNGGRGYGSLKTDELLGAAAHLASLGCLTLNRNFRLNYDSTNSGWPVYKLNSLNGVLLHRDLEQLGGGDSSVDWRSRRTERLTCLYPSEIGVVRDAVKGNAGSDDAEATLSKIRNSKQIVIK